MDAPGRADGYFLSGDEEELHKEDHRDDIRQHGDVLALARAELEHGVADQAQADAVADGAGDRHGDEHDGHRQALINVVKVDLLEAAEHEQADIDERGARRGGGDDGGNGREEHAREEEHAGRQSGQARAAAGLDAGGGLDERRDGGRAGARARDGADGVGQQRLAHARHVAVLVDHAGAARRADERADGVEHVNDAERDDERHDREPADLAEGSKVELEQGRLGHVAERRHERRALERRKRVRVQEDGLARPVDAGRAEHAQQHGALDLLVREQHDQEQAHEHGHDREHHLRVAVAHVGLGKAGRERAEEIAHDVKRAAVARVHTGVGADANVEQHETDGRRDAEPDAERNGLDDLLAHLEHRENDEHDALDEDDAQRRLERLQVAHAGQGDDVGHDDGEKAVETHAGRHGKGLVGRERHDERADGGGDAGGEEHAVPELRAALGAEAGQQVRVERDDVRHGHERRQAGDDLGAYGGVVFFQVKELFHWDPLSIKFLPGTQNAVSITRFAPPVNDKNRTRNVPCPVLLFSRVLRLRGAVALVAGEQNDLPVLRDLPEERHGAPGARIVEIHERVVEHERARIIRRARQLTQRQAHGQVQQIRRPGREIGRVARRRVVGAARLGRQVAREHELVIASVGEVVHVVRRLLRQLRGKAALQLRVRTAERLDRKRDGRILPLERVALFEQLRVFAFQRHRVADGEGRARELRLLRAQARAHALERAPALIERGGLARAALKVQTLQQPLVRLALVLARILERGGGFLLRLHGGRARAVGSPVHLRLIVDAVRVLRAVAAQELPERGGGLLRALLAVIGSDQQHDGQHRERDGRIIQRLRHKITQHRAQRREHERRNPEVRLAAVGCRVSKGLRPLRVALGGLARLVRRLHAEMRLLERGAPGRGVPPRLFERLLERAQVRFFLAHAAQRRAALPLPGGVHLLGHGLQFRVRLPELGGAGRLLLRVALEPVQLLFYLRDAALQLRQRAVPAAAPAAQPCAQLRVGLGVGARLLAGGHDGGDALFQLRRTRHDEAALPDERAAREHLGRHARELLARVRRRQPRHRDVRAGVHRRKAAQRRARRLRPAADRDAFSALFELQLARHGLAAPGRVFLLVGHEPGARALGRVDPVEHGAQKRAPRALAALIRRVDDIQTRVEPQLLAVERAERALHMPDDHSVTTSSSWSSAASPQRAAMTMVSRARSESAASYCCFSWARNCPRSVPSPARAQRSRRARVSSRSCSANTRPSSAARSAAGFGARSVSPVSTMR